MPKDSDIVIVGVGCKFPGANNLQEYWRVLSNGENHVKEIPKDRWNIDAFYDEDADAPGKTYVRRAGFVDGIDEFDNRFYGINDEEAKLIDPQQRLVLDCTQMALEDGGITRKDIEKTNTSVYIGSMTDDYKGHVMDDNTIASAYSVTGTHNSIISARVSYTYNLLGPALTIDTACSSSLVAIDVASQAILAGKCKTAICGGVNVLLDPQLFIALAKARMLSPDGQCKTFTNENKGYARGEGCGIVIIKKFKDALADGNKIWGIITTDTNQDGNIAKPISAPAEEQQRNLIDQLYRNENVDRSKISLIEAHGTGTPIGDPTEVNALGAYFGKKAGTSTDVFIGSVKTNIGHLEAAAGVAGLIKVLLMIKKQTIVPSLWYSTDNENPKLKLSELGFKVPTECLPWKPTSSNVRIACVNSFGFGGTNSHAIVEEYKNQQGKTTSTFDERLPQRIVTISALDNSSLKHNAQVLHDDLDNLDECDIDALSYTSTCKRNHRPVRKAVMGESLNDIKTSLKGFINESSSNDSQTSTAKSLTFVYCGVGTTWVNMCKTLLKLKAFKKAIDDLDDFLQNFTKWRIADKLKSSSDILSDPFTSHLAIFACQVGLTALWLSYGIKPDSVVGQSVGEVAAAYAAGFLSLKDAVKISYYRAKLLAVVKKGSMAVVQNISTAHVQKECNSIGNVVVAVYISDYSCTVSGDESSILKLKEMLKDTEATVKDLDVKCAYHSPFVQEAATQLAAELKDVQELKGNVPMFSTVTGEMETNGLFSNPKYWKENVEKPVVFSTAIKGSAKGKGHAIYLEIGPSPVLGAHVGNILNDNKYTVLPSMKKNDDSKILTETVCKLYDLGYDVNWKEIVPQVNVLTDVPVYQRRKIKNLHISNSSIIRMQGVDNQGPGHQYIRHVRPKDNQIHLRIDVDEVTTPFVFQHIVTDFIIVPGATYADVGFDIGKATYGKSWTNLAVSLEFLRPVKVDKGTKCILDVSTVSQRGETLFHVKQGQMTMCKGWVYPKINDNSLNRMNVEGLLARISSNGCRVLSEEDMYGSLQAMGFKHGECFRMMKKSTTNGVESLTEISVPDDVMKEINNTDIHPCVLDVMLQTTINTTTEKLLNQIREEKIPFLPIAIGDLRVKQKPTNKMYAYTRRINTTILETVFQVHYNILLFTANGNVVADLGNYTTYGKRNQSIAPCELRYRLTWQPLQLRKAETKAIKNPNVLVLTNTFEQSTIELFQNDDKVTLYQHKQQENTWFVSSAFKSNTEHFDAVILLVHPFSSCSDINVNMANELHRIIGHNLMLLTELVLHMTDRRIAIPLYVVTQNTQPTFSHDSSPINLSGEELWGYVRSVYLEFMHGPITMVDVRPSIKETKESLLNLVAATYEDVSGLCSELIIDTNQVYYGQFTKDPRRQIIPTLRSEHKITPVLTKPHSVMSQRSDGSQLAFLAETDSLEGAKMKSGHIELRVKSVCCHPLSMFPRTKEGYKQDPNVWIESMEDGYQLFGLEYSGYILNEKKGKKPSCRSPKVHSDVDTFEHECEYVCIWPGPVNTTMTVPKNSIVNIKDIGGQYEPGILLHAAICWSLVDCVRHRASVLIYSKSPKSIQMAMLADILTVRKSAYIIDPEASSSSKGKTIDVLISLEKIEPSFFWAKYCNRIICLNGCIPESLSIELERSDHKTNVESFDPENILKNVGKKLLDIAPWLCSFRKRSSFASADLNTCRSATNICKSHNLMDKHGLILPVRRPMKELFKKSGVYIITGGLTGLGWEMIKLLAEMGAGVLVAFSRRHVTPQKLIEINAVEASTNCRIISICADVSDYQSLEAGIQEMRNKTEKYDVKGVFHGAGVLDGKLLANLKKAQLENVLKPKVIGTMNMHLATRHFDLDYFVVPSSINSLIGSPGQSSYGAANSFMDTFMEWRRRRGLPGQAINWGALSVGMASRKEFVDNFQSRGFNLLSILEIRSCFLEVLMQNSTSVIYSNIDWDVAAKDYANPNMARLRLQMDILFQQATTSVVDVENDEAFNLSFDPEALKRVGKDDQVQAVHKLVHVVISRVIGNDTHHIEDSSTFEEIGLDSMSKQTFISLIRTITGYQIPTKFMSDTSHSFDDLITHIHRGLFEESTNENTQM